MTNNDVIYYVTFRLKHYNWPIKKKHVITNEIHLCWLDSGEPNQRMKSTLIKMYTYNIGTKKGAKYLSNPKQAHNNWNYKTFKLFTAKIHNYIFFDFKPNQPLWE